MKTWNVTQDISHFTQSFRFRPGCRSLSAVSLKNGHKSENFTFCQHRPFKYFRLDIWMKWKLGQVCGLMCSVTRAFCHFFCGTSSLRPTAPSFVCRDENHPLITRGDLGNMSTSQSSKLKMSGVFCFRKTGFFRFVEGSVNGGRVKGLWKGMMSRKRKRRVG